MGANYSDCKEQLMSNLQNEGKNVRWMKMWINGPSVLWGKKEKEIVTYCNVNHQISGVSVVEVHSQGFKGNWC